MTAAIVPKAVAVGGGGYSSGGGMVVPKSKPLPQSYSCALVRGKVTRTCPTETIRPIFRDEWVSLTRTIVASLQELSSFAADDFSGWTVNNELLWAPLQAA